MCIFFFYKHLKDNRWSTTASFNKIEYFWIVFKEFGYRFFMILWQKTLLSFYFEYSAIFFFWHESFSIETLCTAQIVFFFFFLRINTSLANYQLLRLSSDIRVGMKSRQKMHELIIFNRFRSFSMRLFNLSFARIHVHVVFSFIISIFLCDTKSRNNVVNATKKQICLYRSW